MHPAYGHLSNGSYLSHYPNISLNREQTSTNSFSYPNNHSDFMSSHLNIHGSQKVLVNPHFRTNKVFVNPNFSGAPLTANSPQIHINPQVKNQTLKIHINPLAKNLQLPLSLPKTGPKSVHINPKFKDALSSQIVCKENVPTVKVLDKPLVLTRTKLIRTNNGIKTAKRRNSVRTKYKIVKSSSDSKPKQSRFKIDRTRKLSSSLIAKKFKFVYNSKFVRISDIAKNTIIKKTHALSPVRKTKIVNIHGMSYKTSRNSLRRSSVESFSWNSLVKPAVASKYKFIKKPTVKKQKSLTDLTGDRIQRFKLIRKQNVKKKPARKLKKCNIPCPYYKKYGICKGNENGKCFRKHDPDQIALCTRFLQGACVKPKCLLSHNVSPEKMPTCKYYLEGHCSRENCPYLHVKINANAEICRDFLEGFCRKAAECNKRHQYLCPEFEKYGSCKKQRCPYPHGKMVRNYLMNTAKFAKKCSNKNVKKSVAKTENIVKEEVKEIQRYYIEESKEKPKNDGESNKQCNKSDKNVVGFNSRPKLGNLPAFIPFGET